MADAIRTTCPYCGVGCGLRAVGHAHGPVLSGDTGHPANFGRLCSKGAALGETLGLDGRLMHPRIGGRRAGWDEATALVAHRFGEAIDRHGPDSVAFYVSGQILTEDYYVANKLAKGAIGTANIDTNSRLCMASTVAGHVRAFGEDIVPQTYDDIDEAELVVLVGSNLAWCHPVLHRRLMAARERRGTRIVVIDPRRTATAEDADLHLAIAPDGDVALFCGLLLDAVGRGLVDERWTAAHVDGLRQALRGVRGCDLDWTARATGLARADVGRFFALAAGNERTLTIFSQGVNQSACGTDKVSAILNWHLGTGRIGRAGCGPLSVTGQPNAMGGREVGGLAHQLAAHMDFTPDAIDRVRRFWGYERIAHAPGLKAVDLFDAVADGRIRALWIMGTNPAVSLPRADRVRDAIAACDFTVVSDVEACTDTVRLADVALPALAWGEKDGTVTNSERRISRQRAFLPPPGEARPDWMALRDVARAMGQRGFGHRTAAAVFREHAALSAFENDGARLFDIGGLATLTDAAYDALEPVQWPVPAGRPPGGRLFGSGGFSTASGRALMVATPVGADARRAVDPTRPFTLNTGRVRDHWHTMTRTARSPRLSRHYGEPFLEIHPHDAGRLGVEPAGIVRVESAQGHALLRALPTRRVARGHVFAPMHWTGETAPAGRIGTLVSDTVDPTSGQPASKAVAVSVSPAPMARHGFALLRERPDASALAYHAIARTETGWRLELAAQTGDAFDGFVAAVFGSAPPVRLAGVQTLVADPAIGALWLANGPVAVARDWAADVFDADGVVPRLFPGRPGADQHDPGPTVCACENVGAAVILAAARKSGATVASVGRATRAGTGCGSCRAEIGRLLQSATTDREVQVA